MTGPLRASGDGVLLSVHVQPGAKREGLAGLHGDRVRVRVAAPPEGGRANERVIEVVADAFGLRRGDVTLASGPSSRRKDLRLAGITLDESRRRLQVALGVLEVP